MDELHRTPRRRRLPGPRPRRPPKRRTRSTSDTHAPPTRDTVLQPTQPSPEDGDAEGGIHALLHHGMHLAEHDRCDEAIQVLVRARGLAQTYHLPGLEAQALYNQGTVYMQQEKYRAALPLLKRALAHFGDLGDPRMYASISIALGQALLETHQQQHAVLVLQRALRQISVPGAESRYVPEEWEELRFALLHDLGLAYQLGGQLDRALKTYQQALESDAWVVGVTEYASLFVPLLRLYADLGQMETALTVGQNWLDQLDPTDHEALHLLVELHFAFGLLCFEWERYDEAMRAYKAAYAAWYRLRAQTGEGEQTKGATAFIGKLLTNIGTTYLRQQAYREAVAYLRRGQEILEREGDEEVQIPRRNLDLLRQIVQGRRRFQQLWKESLSLYGQLEAEPPILPG